ncbi:MAG: fused DSP-PTPase phosphatase/NAD kinase-like protein [Planctomycetota bacterium]
MMKKSNERGKPGRRRSILDFLAGAVVACLTVYFVQTYAHEAGILFTNRHRDMTVNVSPERPWAHRLELAGVPNLHKVSDELYRGAQPSGEGMRRLKNLGIKTVVNLRSFHSDRGEIGDTGLAYEHIYMKTWHPEDKEAVRFLQIVSDTDRTPVFVHCKRGADRTGTMCAIYRVAIQGWSKSEAIEEMTKGGFRFYSGWQNLINYVLKLDVDEIKHRAGLNPPPPRPL